MSPTFGPLGVGNTQDLDQTLGLLRRSHDEVGERPVRPGGAQPADDGEADAIINPRRLVEPLPGTVASGRHLRMPLPDHEGRTGSLPRL